MRSPNPSLADRQEQAHAHQVLLDPFQNKLALVCDLGTDMVYVYELDARRGSLSGSLSGGGGAIDSQASCPPSIVMAEPVM